MKYLKIDNGKGYYSIIADQWVEIDKIGKDDVMILLNKVIDTEFEMDEYKSDIIDNKAHQVIYKNLYQKFAELLDNKGRFKDESEQLYKSAIEKYTNKLISEFP